LDIFSSIIQKFEIVDKWLIFNLNPYLNTSKNKFLIYSIAKNLSLLKSIESEFNRTSYFEGWILFRALIDRLVYLLYLSENDLFDQFEEWTFITSFEYRNKARADEKFKQINTNTCFSIQLSESRRYNKLKKKNIQKPKPNPEILLKSRNLEFLYKYGYDFASMHTHPMANDGELEYYRYSKIKPNPYDDFDHSILLKNSILITTLIQTEVLNQLQLKFHRLLYDFFENSCNQANNIENELEATFEQIVKKIDSDDKLFDN
jgi:hypothetical protein